jgi:multicomponent Na+:H+ antiporter subunit C
VFALNYVAAALLFVFGVIGVLTQRNLVRLLLNPGDGGATFRSGHAGLSRGRDRRSSDRASSPAGRRSSDPIVQALTLTSIVIGVVTLAMALALIIQLACPTHARRAHAGCGAERLYAACAFHHRGRGCEPGMDRWLPIAPI